MNCVVGFPCGPNDLYRNVSFKYPGAENYALRNISFALCPGQLCVGARLHLLHLGSHDEA